MKGSRLVAVRHMTYQMSRQWSCPSGKFMSIKLNFLYKTWADRPRKRKRKKTKKKKRRLRK